MGNQRNCHPVPVPDSAFPGCCTPYYALLCFRFHSPARRLFPPPPPLPPSIFLPPFSSIHFLSSPVLSSPSVFHGKLLLGLSYPSSFYLLARVIYLRFCRISAPINATAIPSPSDSDQRYPCPRPSILSVTGGSMVLNLEDIYGPSSIEDNIPNEYSEYKPQHGYGWANTLPERQGLYDPEYEKDACGVGFAAYV